MNETKCTVRLKPHGGISLRARFQLFFPKARGREESVDCDLKVYSGGEKNVKHFYIVASVVAVKR